MVLRVALMNGEIPRTAYSVQLSSRRLVPYPRNTYAMDLARYFWRILQALNALDSDLIVSVG